MADLFTLLAVKAKLVGVAVAAAAVGGSAVALQAATATPPDFSAGSSTTVTAPNPAEIIHEVADTSTAGSAPVTTTGAPVTAPLTCAGATRHGAYVSLVAKGAARSTLAGRGALVSAAAQGNCSKGADKVTSGPKPRATQAPNAPAAEHANAHAMQPAKVAAPGAAAAPASPDAAEAPQAPEAADSGGAGSGPGQGSGQGDH